MIQHLIDLSAGLMSPFKARPTAKSIQDHTNQTKLRALTLQYCSNKLSFFFHCSKVETVRDGWQAKSIDGCLSMACDTDNPLGFSYSDNFFFFPFLLKNVTYEILPRRCDRDDCFPQIPDQKDYPAVQVQRQRQQW